MKRILYTLVLLTLPALLLSQLLPISSPADAGLDSGILSQADRIIETAIDSNETPGAVLVVLRNGTIVFRKAYGNRKIVPVIEPMVVTTIFDLASITKPVATATSVMILVDRGLIRLSDPVSMYIPEFQPWKNEDENRTQEIRIIHLLTHTSGLPAYAPVEALSQQYGHPAPDGVMEYLKDVDRRASPGTSFTYSCPNFITLQRIVETVSGQSLADFSRENIFVPLGMNNTFYMPDSSVFPFIAPTELLAGGELLVGTVHDPLARVMMGCISGNAGLFSTADDLAVFATMMLQNGFYNGVRILSPAAVRTMTHIPPGFEKFGRGLGWDIYSAYASNKGDLFGENAYGHTGYTGTSLVIDPDTGLTVILLTNRVHPDDKASVVRLRSLIANIVAASVIE
jgi:serine-type D-Ala-D-Ala carboxypeptidase